MFFIFHSLLKECFDTRFFNTSLRGYENINGIFIIFNCFFMRMNYFYDIGGVIYSLDNELNLTLNECNFYKCSAKQFGCIFIKNSLGATVQQNKICASMCSALLGFQYGYVLSTNNIETQNSFILSSIINSFFDESGYTLQLTNGYQTISNYNSSKNLASHATCLRLSSGKFSKVIHSNFHSNHIKLHIIIDFEIYLNHLLTLSNIINNTSPTWGIITTMANGYVTVDHCIFFQNNNILFYIYSGGISVQNCILNHFNNSITGNNVNLLTNNTITNLFLIETLNISLLNPLFCIIPIKTFIYNNKIFFNLILLLFFNIIF